MLNAIRIQPRPHHYHMLRALDLVTCATRTSRVQSSAAQESREMLLMAMAARHFHAQERLLPQEIARPTPYSRSLKKPISSKWLRKEVPAAEFRRACTRMASTGRP